ncbi:hypothetical protein K461DRAFT_274714 [Myriangium duriaei CBS 260.36]|uniref:Amino acid transporter transmembrane domain-containing protein n=1 Tax=Myriangium duriaei CBS 260.36 TaxID=1168546 RepID=A0A9P4MJY0_9PEZI|nr:hypothetical protein K461DRAFT_274714 [Myriangium duriaei CBS 260.36]
MAIFKKGNMDDIAEDIVPQNSNEHGTDSYKVEHDPFGNEEGSGIHYKSLKWWQCSLLMIAETISLGILSLPAVIATMGFIPGVLLILGFGIICTYTGYVMGQFRQAHPSIHSFADAGQMFLGRPGRYLVEVAQALVLTFIVAAHILTFSIMMNVLTGHATCTVTWAAIGTIITLVMSLPRTLKNISLLSFFSCMSILVAVIVTMIAVGIVKPDAHSAVLVVPGYDTSVQNYALGISNILIAFTGHTAYFTFIAELKRPEDFPKSLALLQSLCITAYVVIAVVIYAYAGKGVAAPALSSTTPIVRKIAYGIAIPTIVVAGVVNAHVCIKNIYVRMWRGTDVMHQKGLKSLGSWYGLAFVCCVAAFLIANAIPVFSDLLGLLGALFCTWFSLGLPSSFWLAMNKHQLFINWKKSSLTVLNILICLISLVMCVMGTWASIKSIVDASTTRKPFSCADNS